VRDQPGDFDERSDGACGAGGDPRGLPRPGEFPARLYYASTRGDAARIGFDDAYIFEQLRLPAGERAIPTAQLLRDKALAAFAEWERKQDRLMY
jgi:hypothetical protein